jgi:lipopolysaccharide export system permease protein
MPIKRTLKEAPQGISRFWNQLKPWLPNRIDRYILTEILGPAIGGLLFFSFVFLLFQALRLSEFLIAHRAQAWDVIELVGCILLIFIPAIVPISFLIGVMVGFGRLSADSELVAIKAGGVSIYRMAMAAVVLAGVTTFLSIKLATEWSPHADRKQSEVLSRIANRKIARSLHAGIFQADFFDLLVFAEKKDTQTDRLKNVFIFDERNPKDPLTIIAKEGEIVSAISKNEFDAAIVLRLFDGNIHRTSETSESYQKVDFGEYRVFLEMNGTEANAGYRPRFLTSEEILVRLNSDKAKNAKGKAAKRYRLLAEEYWKRYAIGISPFFLCLLGVGLGTIRTRAMRSGATLLSFVIVLVYYGLLLTSQDLAPQLGIPTSIAMNLPNVLSLLASWRAIRSAAW